MSRMVRTAAAGAVPTIPSTPHDRWKADRLGEARAILAGPALHSDRLLILAARVVVAHSADRAEVGRAQDLWRSLDPRPLANVAQALAARRRSEGGRTAP